MDEAGARVVGDVVAREHGDVVVPFAVRAVHATERVGHDEAREFLGRDVAQAADEVGVPDVEAGAGEDLLGEGVGDQVAVADARPALPRGGP